MTGRTFQRMFSLVRKYMHCFDRDTLTFESGKNYLIKCLKPSFKFMESYNLWMEEVLLNVSTSTSEEWKRTF